MLITRKIGKLLRGKATPMQISLACILGSLLGFMPGFVQAPGLIVLLVMLLAVLNANLFIAAGVGVLAKLVSLLAMPVSFGVGRVLLDGPTSSLFAFLINAPVTALMGFEYYATTGGIVVGAAFGIIMAMIVIRLLQGFRKKMASLQEGSERYKKWHARPSVRIATFIFIGGGGKKDYQQLLAKRTGNPIRVMGVVGAVLLLGLLGVLYQFASGPIVTAALQRGLERANGATVDVRDASLDLGQGRLTLSGFAMADPNDLDVDLLRADELEADVSGMDLLRKRISLDQARLRNASTGETRATPGRRVGRWPEPKPAPDDDPQQRTIEEYIKQAEVWKDRLSQLRQWLEQLSGPEDVDEDEPEEQRETFRERLERRIAERGYANVRATHLVTGAPTFMIYRLDAEEVRVAYLEGTTLTIRGRNLSTHPHLAEGATSIDIDSNDDSVRARVSLEHVVSETASSLEFALNGLSVDTVASQLSASDVISGGTMDLSASGTYGGESAGWIDLPLNVTMHDTTLALGSSEKKVSRFQLPIGLRGPLDNPGITIDGEQLADAFLDAGASELLGEVEDRFGDEIDEVTDNLPDGVGDSIRDGASRFLGGDD